MKKYPEVNSIKVVVPAQMMTSNGRLVKKILTKSGAPRKIGGKRTIQLEVEKGTKKAHVVHEGRLINRKGEENKKRGRKPKEHVEHHAKVHHSHISSSNIIEGKRKRTARHSS